MSEYAVDEMVSAMRNLLNVIEQSETFAENHRSESEMVTMLKGQLAEERKEVDRLRAVVIALEHGNKVKDDMIAELEHLANEVE